MYERNSGIPQFLMVLASYDLLRYKQAGGRAEQSSFVFVLRTDTLIETAEHTSTQNRVENT
jgi:hypothetical protein